MTFTRVTPPFSASSPQTRDPHPPPQLGLPPSLCPHRSLFLQHLSLHIYLPEPLKTSFVELTSLGNRLRDANICTVCSRGSTCKDAGQHWQGEKLTTVQLNGALGWLHEELWAGMALQRCPKMRPGSWPLCPTPPSHWLQTAAGEGCGYGQGGSLQSEERQTD